MGPFMVVCGLFCGRFVRVGGACVKRLLEGVLDGEDVCGGILSSKTNQNSAAVSADEKRDAMRIKKNPRFIEDLHRFFQKAERQADVRLQVFLFLILCLLFRFWVGLQYRLAV